MNIQFCHKRVFEFNMYRFDSPKQYSAKGGLTIAMQELTSWFVNSLQEGEFFVKAVGAAQCSTKDNYNKKVGREIASQRLKQKQLTVDRVVVLIVRGTQVKQVELVDKDFNMYIIRTKVDDNDGAARFVNFIPFKQRNLI
jgi:hypothetical protein